MITPFQKITTAFALTLSLAMISCEKDSLVTPVQPTVAPAPETMNDDISPKLAQTYKLTRFGLIKLTYYADGRLKQVTTGEPVRGSVAYSRDYTYDDANHVINATSHAGGKTILIDTYYMDEQKGRCIQSKQIDYTILDKPNPVNNQLNSHWYYQYNDKGQLARVHNLFLPGSNRTEYAYNADGDLIKTTTYDQVAGQDGVLIQTLALSYTQSPSVRGATLLPDQYPLNAGWVRLPLPGESIKGQPVPDQYLQIFGKPSPHLVTGAVQTQHPGNRPLLNSLFTYQLNAAGYVTERKELDAHSSALLDTKPYDYQVTNVGVQF